MKTNVKTSIPTLAVLFLTSFVPAVVAQKSDPALVTTTGMAEVKVVPDLADMSFEVEVRNVELAEARKAQSDRAKRLLKTLRDAGIADNDLQTSQVRITPVYVRDEKSHSETDKIHYFSVSQTVTCTLKDIKKVPDITGEAVNAGATGVGGVHLRTTKLRQVRDEARLMAIRAAKEKATALVNELGVKLGKPHHISEVSHQPMYAAMQNNIRAEMAPGGQGDSVFAPGTISITAEVQVAFVIE